ncbi:uncharacterized protein BKCO1_5900034 [Diplodia corticola]|uniref:Uncharacterized protein n=1 Tax=Diplodia corticola TaxID=236234 RepID=A0A1J9RSP0_9PEZI|nr:uncharacterized protein BKCO1_5900034 [Diplodia corticola]OJD30557.1 hypothetical protein BKCO1_5900034 [Diplodia corticola]
MATPPLEPRRTFSAPSISVEDTSYEEPLESVQSDDPPTPEQTLPKRRTEPPPEQPRYGRTHRRRSPGPDWNTAWDPSDWKDGRVLVVDYLGRSDEDGKRRISAQEIRSLKGLRSLLENRALRASSILRVVHVQNASWANNYLLRKFNMEHDDDIVGTAFGRWARFERPQQRAGKPVLNARAFRPQRDPWRGVSRCAFGLDYLKQYDARKYNKDADDEKVKMMELNAYDAFETPVYGHDVFVQRLSVYVQHREPHEDRPELHAADFEMPMRNPYNQEEYGEYKRLKRQYEHRSSRHKEASGNGYFPHLEELDNGSTIIVFENSQSNSPEDTLIQARNEIEARWRRLPFYLKKEQKATDEQLAVECMDLVLKDVFKAITVGWERFMRACETHVSILEDKIYENPADESRAPELWINSSLWLKVEKLIYLHIDLAKDVRNMMGDVTGDEGPDEWISQSAEEFDKIANSVNEDLIKPTQNLSDMMYKSVEIRDSRLGLQLDTSMWRLSWITFIFLPLTFISGFFGMNVDIFSKDENNPELKWYFIVTVPLMATVVLFWLFFKRAGPGLDNDPTDSQRGVYEHLFHEFSDNYPRVWTREGPRLDSPSSPFSPSSSPSNVFARLKWRLVRHWFDPDRTIRARGYSPADDLGPYARFKRAAARRWLRQLENDARDRAVRLQDAAAERRLDGLQAAGDNGNGNSTTPFDLAPAMEAGTVIVPGPESEGPLVDWSRSSSGRIGVPGDAGGGRGRAGGRAGHEADEVVRVGVERWF